MQHVGTQTLETERLILRRYTKEDAPAMYRNWASDDEVTKFLTWPTHPNEAVTQMVVDDWVSHYGQENFYHWAIVLKDNGDEPVGDIAVVQVMDVIEAAEIGYCIGRKWWHQGITSEALRAVMDFLFDTVGLNRVEAGHDVNNPHSGGVMKKNGMKYEGTLRQSGRNNQGIVDVCRYAQIKADR